MAAIPVSAWGAKKGPELAELASRAAAGDRAAAAGIETLATPFFERKDLFALDEVEGAREAARALGEELPVDAVKWFGLSGPGGRLRLLTLDLGVLAPQPSSKGARVSDYVAYAIVEGSEPTGTRVSWYHDPGRKRDEQGGVAWHPVGARQIQGSATQTGRPAGPGEGRRPKRTIAVEEAAEPGGEPRGLLILETAGEGWSASSRLAPPGPSTGAHLIGEGSGGAVFVTGREPPKGARLTGAPAGLQRSLLFYDRREGTFVDTPVMAALPDVVSASERVIEALSLGERFREQARRLCVSPDVVEQLLYFSPTWSGGGRILHAGSLDLEFVYEERGRPTLRLHFVYEARDGLLLLSAATGRAESPGN